jgi:hypothetical protein
MSTCVEINIKNHMESRNFSEIELKNDTYNLLKNGCSNVSEDHNLKILSSLTDEQRSKIVELLNLIPSESKNKWSIVREDMTLYRFLQARKWVVADALSMLENHLKWREETYPIKKSQWINDPFFKSGSCIIGSGLDKGGRPIIVLKSGRFPVAERNLDNCVAGFVALMTELMNIYGTHTRFTILYDRQDFVKKDNLDLDLLKQIAKVFSDNMPETMERSCVYPCGPILRGLWQIVKWFFDPVTRSKISLLGSPEAFNNYVDNDNLMDDMGGSSGFSWNWENWINKFVNTLPDETNDNWLSKPQEIKRGRSELL